MNPYDSQPDHSFWGRAISKCPLAMVDPVQPLELRLHGN